MTQIKVLNVYKWATMGGVERVFLNRAHAFKEAKSKIQYDVHFMHDSGGLSRFKKYIENKNLENNLRLVEQIKAEKYDVILSVDTPEILDYTNEYHKIFIECHTSYKENRSYIKKLPPNLGGIIVPSSFFANELKKELPFYLNDKLSILSNFVVESTASLEFDNLIYQKTPLFYVGRLDKLKNIEEIMNILSIYIQEFNDDFILILAGPIIDHEVNLNQLLEKYKITNRVVYLPPIDFEHVDKIFKMVMLHNGIFISASTSETFGLSSAEAIMGDIPVLLSKIRAHEELVENDDQFLYSLGDVKEAARKLHAIYQNYNIYRESLKKFQFKLSKKQFLRDWNYLLEGVMSEKKS